MRKVQDQNSAESGYSDEHPSDPEGDDEEAGTSTKAKKVDRFGENLQKFDRTASPISSERRRSETPLIADFSKFFIFSRAQSEPPRIPSNDNNDADSFEVLDLIPNPLVERCVVIQAAVGESNRLIVTQSPEVLVHAKPKLKAQLRKNKRDKKVNTIGNAKESAEEMFLRLTGSKISEASSSSSIDEDDHENVEDVVIQESSATCVEAEAVCEIQEINDEPQPSTSVTDKGDQTTSLEADAICGTQAVGDEPQPLTSMTEKDDLTSLSTKEQDYLQRREDRLKRLEEESQAFYERMARNKDKSIKLDNHLNDIHQTFLDRNREKDKSEDDKTEDEPSDEASTSGEAENKSQRESERKEADE